MSAPTLHIINHTHWDREWFLTSQYTSQWIPGLIDKLVQLVGENPAFSFFLDGQTLVIEDLLRLAPDYLDRVKALIEKGNLLVGPYYCQPDWQITGGELLIRNLLYGIRDVQRLGGAVSAGWLVDTFGHISQSPQIHRLFGLDAVFVWRGVPQLNPYFHWQAPDGSRILAINLFGGYRNLYGVSHAPEVAVDRLHMEANKLQPFYPTPDIPLFDGYDLEDNPEDPIRFYSAQQGVDVDLLESTPAAFAHAIREKGLALPTLHGELNSGKYGATFPGTFSARTYLKLMAHDCEVLLFQRCEPLAVMARLRGRPFDESQVEHWSRLLLQNAVHDCICGVSIDQVHEKMEYSYRQVFDAMTADIELSLGAIMHDFAAGDYAISTNPMPSEDWQMIGDQLIHTQTDGIGVWPVRDASVIEPANQPANAFAWQNAHYIASIYDDGSVQVGDSVLGAMIVSAEQGDTYSDERGERLGNLRAATPPFIERQNDQCCVIRYEAAWQDDTRSVHAFVRIMLDPSPLIKWQIELESRGTDLRVELLVVTNSPIDRVRAGTPFDIVERALTDADLLPRQLPEDLASVLLGQRELNAVESFPFHDFVALEGKDSTTAVLARGLRAYRVENPTTLVLTLRRSVQWLTKANLQNRIGDAGPFFYVPDARCERTETHEIAAALGPAAWTDTATFQNLVAAYRNPPIIVRNRSQGREIRWRFLSEQTPISSLSIHEGAILARFYNPTSQPLPLSQAYLHTDVWGKPLGQIEQIAPKQIAAVQVANSLPHADHQIGRIEVLNAPRWRIEPPASRPDPAVLRQLKKKIAALEAEVGEIEAKLATAAGTDRLHLQHRYYVLKRESVEFQLSVALNEREIRLTQQGNWEPDYLYKVDPEIAEIGLNLNHLRIKRRIFDYVAQVAAHRSKAGS